MGCSIITTSSLLFSPPESEQALR